jgi:hypothetical protein
MVSSPKTDKITYMAKVSTPEADWIGHHEISEVKGEETLPLSFKKI